MRRRSDRPTTKHTLNLYAGDYDRLMALYGARVGAAKIIRDLIHAYIRKIENDATQKQLEPRELDHTLIDNLDVELEAYNNEQQ